MNTPQGFWSSVKLRDWRFSVSGENSDELARFAAHRLPYYEHLHTQRLDVSA